MTTSYAALNTYLEPLQALFQEEGVNEISINQECEVWIENRGNIRCESIPVLNLSHLKALGRLIAQATEQKISEENPLLSATLPNGYRIQIVFPPACEASTVAMSIRKPSAIQLSLDDYEKMGAFSQAITEKQKNSIDIQLNELLKQKKIKEFLEQAILHKKNIIISGGTSTGKTTFTNAALRTIPNDERLITVEDAREIVLNNHPNRIHLITSKGGQGRARVSIQGFNRSMLKITPR